MSIALTPVELASCDQATRGAAIKVRLTQIVAPQATKLPIARRRCEVSSGQVTQPSLHLIVRRTVSGLNLYFGPDKHLLPLNRVGRNHQFGGNPEILFSLWCAM
jgi:hypothetical protein